jgi:hypothetical protein
MVSQAEAAGVPVLLADPVCNLKDCPPFKVEIDTRLPESDRELVQNLLDALSAQPAPGRPPIDMLNTVLQLDRRHAGAWFLLGQAHLAALDYPSAREALVQAKDQDICPLRIIEPLREAIVDVGRTSGAAVVRVREEFERRSPHGILGDELLLDHVHPTISGHQIIAELILDSMVRGEWVTLSSGWKERQQQLYREHFAMLDTPYFARGQEHLEGLRKWTQGRVTQLRGEK